jgi:microcystin-dependent protein
MATVTASYNWVSGETVTPAKLNSAAAPTVVVADNEVTTAKIADLAVTAGKLAGTLDLSSKTVTLPNTSVALAQLVTAVQQALLPAGAVQAFAMNSAPAGWLAADGSNVNRTTYAALFSAISTTYGVGDGSTTFALPDLRGYFVRGSGTNSDGAAAGTFGAKQADELKEHTHTLLGANNTGGAGGQITRMADNMSNFQSGSFGGTETRPKNIAMLYCIKF